MPDESLSSKESYEANETQKSTLEVAEKTGLGELIKEVSDELSLETFEAQSDIPIPVERIPLGEKEVVIDSAIDDTLEMLTETANDLEQPLEVPFAILGNPTSLSRTQMLFNTFESLDNITVAIDPEKLGASYQQVVASDELSTLVVAHTHPKIPETAQETVLASRISQGLKEKYEIKEVGLHLSLQDLYQLESLYEQVGDKVNVMLGVLPFDGNLILVERTEEGFRRVRHSKSSQHRSILCQWIIS